MNIKHEINQCKEQIKQLRLKISKLEDEYKLNSDNTNIFNYEHNNKNTTGCCYPWCYNHNGEFPKTEFDNTAEYDTHKYYSMDYVYKCQECYLYACYNCYNIDKLSCDNCVKL